MKIFFTLGKFEYRNLNSRKLVTTENKIPFIVDQNCALIDDVNKYLLFKTEIDWNPESDTALINAENILSYLTFCLNNQIDWREATSIDINKYISYLSKNNQKENTIKGKVSTIQNLYLWLVDHSFLDNNPFWDFNTRSVKRVINVFSNKTMQKTFDVNSVKNKIIKDSSVEDIPTKEEVKAFYDNLTPEDKIVALSLIGTGMRKCEALQLTKEMILNMRDNGEGRSYSLFLDASKIKIKYNKSRYVTVSSNLRLKILKHLNSRTYKRYLKKYLIKNPDKNVNNSPIFLSNRGSQYSENKINSSFNIACEKAKLDTSRFVKPHQLRHFYASRFIARKDESGESLEDAYMYLAERLGHSSVDTTKEYYVKIINKMKQEKDLEVFAKEIIEDFLG